jgi:hypothetical protein
MPQEWPNTTFYVLAALLEMEWHGLIARKGTFLGPMTVDLTKLDEALKNFDFV